MLPLALLLCLCVVQTVSNNIKVEINNRVARSGSCGKTNNCNVEEEDSYPQLAFPQGVWSGDPSPTSVSLVSRVVSASTDPESPVTLAILVQVSTSVSFSTVVVNDVAVSYSDHVYKAVAKGLQPDTKYYFRFGLPRGGWSPTGMTKTLTAPDTSSAKVKFAISSCANIPPFDAIDTALANDFKTDGVEFWIIQGDTIYADRWWISPEDQATTPEEYNGLYQTLIGSYFKQTFPLAPYFAFYDDHEVTDGSMFDSATGGYVQVVTDPRREASVTPIDDLREIAMSAFNRYHPRNTDTLPSVPGVAKRKQLFRSLNLNAHVDLIMLDTRQYQEFIRPPFTPPPGILSAYPPGITRETLLQVAALLLGGDSSAVEGFFPAVPDYTQHNHTLLGAIQKEWFKQRLLTSTKKWKFVASGKQFTNAWLNAEDTWIEYPNERDELQAFIEDNNIENVIFLSGDLHLPSIWEVNPNRAPGKPVIWEVQCGPLGQGFQATTLGLAGLPEPALDIFVAFAGKPDPAIAPQQHILGAPPADTLRFLNLNSAAYAVVDVNEAGDKVRIELRGEDGAVLKAHQTQLPNVGLLTMQEGVLELSG